MTDSQEKELLYGIVSLMLPESMLDYADRAKALLSTYPDSPFKTALCTYVDYVVGRDI